MGLTDTINEDIQQITSDLDGFGVSIKLTAPNDTIIDIVGLTSKHHLGYDTDGNQVNTKNAHISFSEKFLIDASYPLRNASGEVDLKGHLADVKDSTGVVKKYIIREWFPDETIGLIVCILGDYE